MKIDLNKYKEYVTKTGAGRKKLLGKDFHQADFVAGAMCAFAMLDKMGEVPPMWVFGIMAGMDVFSEEGK